ncbi:ATP synthase F1 subunit gamma [Desulforegula conservatrix]|uniref:ATP synthase F1 subunit gamma n=1 Tax=Desulforegula conservatrix TaxID=153026 RepID=UPI000400CF6A|nr:ATP synthase F1 subunit gamma [Desulforegula conservatrix]
MAKLKEIKLKISGVKKTKQITKAMNMVAASRLRGSQRSMEQFRPYAAKFAEVLGSLAARSGSVNNPLLTPKEEVRKVHFVLCTSDRGLCGGFNINLVEALEDFVKEEFSSDVQVTLSCFGKKGRDWALQNDYNVLDSHVGVIGSRIGFHIASGAGQNLVNSFLQGEWDEVYLISSKFKSMSRQIAEVEKILPIPPIEASDTEEAEGYEPEHICEPSTVELFNEMLPKSVYIKLFSAFLETSTSEHAARMVAMDNATRACNDLIKDLVILFNKARQAAITADLIDIVGGAEALKG